MRIFLTGTPKNSTLTSNLLAMEPLHNNHVLGVHWIVSRFPSLRALSPKRVFKSSLLLFAVIVSIGASAVLPAFAETAVVVEINKGKMVKFPSPASSVVIADPNTADIQVVSPQTVFVYGKKVGETSLSAVGANDESIFQGTIEVTHNLSGLKRTVKRVAPEANVNFKTVDGGLVIDGSAVSIQESESIRNIASAFVGDREKVVNMVTTGGGDQVTLQVKIVEMARTDLKNLGINLQASVNGGGIVSQVVNGVVEATEINPLRAGNTNLLTTLTGGAGSISSLIEALETEGLATILAEPSLTTATGKPASFLAGGQYPIPVAGTDGTVTVQYQPFGVSLNFTPVVMSNDRMSILVNPEVSTLNFANPIQVAGFTYPILDTRKAQATVELGSGQTFVLAGLLRNDTANNITKLPGAGDLPILGALFRSQRFQSNQSELVILVTPYIVHPISEAKKVQTPLDGFKPPSDLERIMLGSLYEQQDMPSGSADKKEKAADREVSVDANKLEKLSPSAGGDEAKSKGEARLNGENGFILE